MSPRLTHVDERGRARMVDVGDKPASERRAVARARVRVSPQTALAVQRGDAPKGDVLATARIAGIQAAKRTWELIPLCHPLALTFVGVEGEVDVAAGEITLTAEARTTGPTGGEMETLTAERARGRRRAQADRPRTRASPPVGDARLAAGRPGRSRSDSSAA